jgi:hypothetical protein
VSGSTVVYAPVGDEERDIYAFDLATGTQTRLELPGAQWGPTISGTSVAFTTWMPTSQAYQIRLWDLVSGLTFDFAPADGTSRFTQQSDGNRVVYTFMPDVSKSEYLVYLSEFTIDRGRVDSTPPSVTITSPAQGATYLRGQVITPAWTVTDADDPAPTVTAAATVDTTTTGDHTYAVTATDSAGNVGTATVTYSVAFESSGVAQPVNRDGSSIFRAGSTVPIRVPITDAAGAPLVGLAPRLYLAKVAEGVTGTETEAISTAAASDGNVLRETSPGTYLFNLATRGLATGTWQARVEIGGGACLTFIFSLS